MLFAQINDEDIDFSNKLHLVDEFAKRWWYALPIWPPADFDYNAQLSANNLEAVEQNKLKEKSSSGQERVCQVEGYPGVYRDAKGRLYDMRPQESMPSLQNFQKMNVRDLQGLLAKAYDEQQKQLNQMIEGKSASYDRATELEVS